MSQNTLKAHAPAKIVIPQGLTLDKIVSTTMSVIAGVVGGTLGPGGRPVALQRPEYGVPPTVTKDGVTVVRSLGFQSSAQQAIYEIIRDVASRTVDEAGDGTTTSVVLAEALRRRTRAYCQANPGLPPQQVVDGIRRAVPRIVNLLRTSAVPTPLGTPEGDRLLHAVAETSGNGDTELADAVMSAFEICGDLGNVTIHQATGPSGYRVEKIEGYPVEVGYESAVGRLAQLFVNRSDTQQVVLDRPVFLIYYGQIRDIQTLAPVLQQLQDALENKSLATPNVVVVATAFGDRCIESLAHNWSHPTSINVFPLSAPVTALEASQRQFLDDLAGVVDAVVMDPHTAPLDQLHFSMLGNCGLDEETGVWKPQGTERLEVSRYRSTVIGTSEPDRLLERIGEVEKQVEQSNSGLDKIWNQERLARLTGGIAKLTVIGGSNAEIKEKCDRAEDAVCAVRGCLKRSKPGEPANGCLPGGGWAPLKVASILVGSVKAPGPQISAVAGDTELFERLKWTDGVTTTDLVLTEVLALGLVEPVIRILLNVGISEPDILDIVNSELKGIHAKEPRIYNAATHEFVDPLETGLVDSVPAVREAIRNAAGLAAVTGTLGGLVVSPRDTNYEREEAAAAAEFDRMISRNLADERP